MSCLTCLVFNCVYCFFLKRWNYITTFVLHEQAVLLPNFLLRDWRHKRLKNITDLLLFHGEHFYEFSESDKYSAECFVKKEFMKIWSVKSTSLVEPSVINLFNIHFINQTKKKERDLNWIENFKIESRYQKLCCYEFRAFIRY